MNFKLNRQHILHLALLLAILLVAIYLLKPTLEGEEKFVYCNPTTNPEQLCPDGTPCTQIRLRGDCINEDICPCPHGDTPTKDEIEGIWIASPNSGRDLKGNQLRVEITKDTDRGEDYFTMKHENKARYTSTNIGGKTWKSASIKKIRDNLYEFRYTFNGTNKTLTLRGKIVNGELVVCGISGIKVKSEDDLEFFCVVYSSYTRTGTNNQYDRKFDSDKNPILDPNSLVESIYGTYYYKCPFDICINN